MQSETEDCVNLFYAHCCYMGTAIKHPVPDRVKPSFVTYDIRALCHSGLDLRVRSSKSTWVDLGLSSGVESVCSSVTVKIFWCRRLQKSTWPINLHLAVLSYKSYAAMDEWRLSVTNVNHFHFLWSRLKSTQVTCLCQVKWSQVECDQIDGGRLGVDFSLKSDHVSVPQWLAGLGTERQSARMS